MARESLLRPCISQVLTLKGPATLQMGADGGDSQQQHGRLLSFCAHIGPGTNLVSFSWLQPYEETWIQTC